MIPGSDDHIRRTILDPLIGTSSLAASFKNLSLKEQIDTINLLSNEANKQPYELFSKEPNLEFEPLEKLEYNLISKAKEETALPDFISPLEPLKLIKDDKNTDLNTDQ